MPAYVYIIIVVVIVLVVNVIRINAKSSKNHFECPNCGEHFQASFGSSFFTAHSLGGEYSMTCPKCKKTSMMTSLPGKE